MPAKSILNPEGWTDTLYSTCVPIHDPSETTSPFVFRFLGRLSLQEPQT